MRKALFLTTEGEKTTFQWSDIFVSGITSAISESEERASLKRPFYKRARVKFYLHTTCFIFDTILRNFISKFQSLHNLPPTLNDDTKILTETDTEIFFPIPNFPKPIPRLFSDTKFFRNRYRDFFSDTKFSETETDTLKKLAKVSKPKCQSLLSSSQPVVAGWGGVENRVLRLK